MTATDPIYLGDIPQEVFEITERAWESPFTVSSDLARQHAHWVAFAASLGWITIIGLDGTSVGRTWHVTFRGTAALQHREYLLPCTKS